MRAFLRLFRVEDYSTYMSVIRQMLCGMPSMHARTQDLNIGGLLGVCRHRWSGQARPGAVPRFAPWLQQNLQFPKCSFPTSSRQPTTITTPEKILISNRSHKNKEKKRIRTNDNQTTKTQKRNPNQASITADTHTHVERH